MKLVKHSKSFQVDVVKWRKASWANKYLALAKDGLLKPGQAKAAGVWK